MIRLSKEEMIKNSIGEIDAIYTNISSKEDLNLKDINLENSALIIVDMINGFVRCGALKSERVEGIVSNITRVQKHFKENNGTILAFVDSHTESAAEFTSYPPHCIKGSGEDEILDEMKSIGGYTVIEKNSTNGFIEDEFKKFLNENKHIENFIIVGCCTDICVMQFALTFKNYFNMTNATSKLIVPVDSVETFDLESHNGDFIDILSLQLMEWAGVQIVSSIK